MMPIERWVVAAMLGLGLASTAGAPGQSPAQEPPDDPPAQAAPPAPPAAAADPVQEQLQKDTDHLLQLVQELKLEVAKAGSNTLSLTALRKADEVQKLAKNLKETMKERGQVSQSKP
jgi:hypothetical protein